MEQGFKQVWQLFAELWEDFKETDRRQKQTDQQLKELKTHIDRVTKNVGDLTGKWGKFVEGLVLPAVKKLFAERGIDLETIYHRAETYHNGKKMEIDILGVNGEYVVLIEVKSSLGVEDVKEHLERIKTFKSYFPRYKDQKIIGAVAGIVIEENADVFAYKKGLFVIAESDDTVAFLNDEKFEPKIW